MSSFAQQHDVTGKIVSEDNNPIEGASVYLLTAKSEALMKTTLTDESGGYTFKNVPHGEFIVQVTSVGFQLYKSTTFSLNDQAVKMDAIILKPEAKAIAEVAVEGRVPLVQQRDGKLVLNVENSTLAAGNTAFEVVQRAPGVSVDKDENLQLMGQAGINVTIDGRQTYMSGEQLTALLKSMNGDQIKSIEVSTTRSAKDDAEGTVGSINIVLKKNRLEGFNGTFQASAGYGRHARGNSSLNLNYKKENTTVFGSYGFTRNKNQYDIDIERVIPAVEGDRVFNQDATMKELDKTHNYRIGVEQKTSDRNTMVLQFSGINEVEDSENSSITNIGSSLQSVDSILHSNSLQDRPFNRYSLNFNNELKVDTLGGKLVLDLDWSAFRTDADNHYEYRTYLPDGSLKYDPELEWTGTPVKIDIYVGKLDFTKTIGKAKFESGLKYSNVKSDNDLQFEHFVNGQWQDYAGRPNHFVYTEQISAGYIDYSQAFGKMSVKLGLRGEYTVSDGHSITLDSRVKRDYFDIFPSANVGYTVNENHVLSLSYARKVSRPNYRFLNPFEYFIDKFTSQRGNPYLNPQYTNGITLNYTAFKMFNFTLGTDISRDAIVESLDQDSVSGKAWVTRDNLGESTTSYLNINAPFRIGKFWTMNNNLTTIYMTFKGPIAGSYINDGSVFFQGRSMNNFRISPAFSAEMSVNYSSPFLYNVYRIHARWGMDLGVNYNFKEGRHSLKLAGTDIFRTQKNNLSTDFASYNAKIRQYHDSRSIRLTYTYKFGNLKQQMRRNGGDSEEKSRAM